MICVETCHLLKLADSISKLQLNNVGLLAVENKLKVTEIVTENRTQVLHSLFSFHVTICSHMATEMTLTNEISV